jgi:DNA-directed RNA polymerase specialized sigma24 family protein
VTARNEALRILRRRQYQVPVSHERLTHIPEIDERGPDAAIIEAEETSSLWLAFERIPVPCRVLLRMLMEDPPPSYSIVSETLGMPIGSIGPRRSRCLNHLRNEVEQTTTEPALARSVAAGGSR